jgi:hypothetical protein
MKRDRAWRRFQNEKIIKKRLNIIKIWCSGSHYDGKHDHFERSREYIVPGYLKKWNFTCSCYMCKIDTDKFNVKQRQKEKEYERVYSKVFRSNNFSH